MIWIVWFLRPKLCLAPSRRSPCAIKDVGWGTAYRFENRSSWPCNPLWSTLGRFEGKKNMIFTNQPASHPPNGHMWHGGNAMRCKSAGFQADRRMRRSLMLRRCWGYHGSWVPTCTMSWCLHRKQRAAMFPWWEQKKLPLFETHVKEKCVKNKLIEA